MASWLDDERELLARTLTAEAGNQGSQGLLAAGSVIMNRAKQGGYGDGVRGVILKPGQFSPLNSLTGYAGGEQGQNMAAIKPTPEAYQVADALISGNYQDPTGGATHFYNPDISSPSWGGGDGWTRIGDHVFGRADAGRGGNMQANVNQRAPVISTSGAAQQPSPQGQSDQPFYKNPDFWDRLAIGFSGMTLNPNEALINASAQRIDRRAEGRQTEKQRNATAEWLRSQGRDDLADAVSSGAIGGRDALGLMQPEKQEQTAAMQNYEFLVSRGVPPEEAQKQAFGRGGTTVNVGSQQSTAYGDAPKGTVWEYDDQGNHVMEPAPGGGMRPKVIPLGGTEAEKRAADISGGAKSNQDAAARAQDSMNLIKSVMDDPALGQITGMIQGRLPPITQSGTDLGVKIEQLQGQAFLAAFESLKGGGQITEREGQAAQNAMARLQRAQSEKAFRASLAELYDIMDRARRRASGETVPDIGDGSDGFSVTGRIK